MLLIAGYALLRYVVETDVKQMDRRIQEIGKSVKERQIRSVLDKHLSDDFRVTNYNKQGFIEHAEALRQQYNVDSLEVWGIEVMEIDREKGTAKMGFKVKPKVPDHETPHYLVEADFVLTPSDKWWKKGEWKMKTFRYFNPAADSSSPLPIP
jgi:hypothetical protein